MGRKTRKKLIKLAEKSKLIKSYKPGKKKKKPKAFMALGKKVRYE